MYRVSPSVIFHITICFLKGEKETMSMETKWKEKLFRDCIYQPMPLVLMFLEGKRGEDREKRDPFQNFIIQKVPKKAEILSVRNIISSVWPKPRYSWRSMQERPHQSKKFSQKLVVAPISTCDRDSSWEKILQLVDDFPRSL